MKKKNLVFMSIVVFFMAIRFDNTLFLPIIIREYCFDKFRYDESVPWNLQAIDIIKIWDICGSKRGWDITVAIVDSGIDLQHPELKPNIVSGRSFVQNADDVADYNGHGTHLAGIIAAVANNAGVIGVAPRARLMPVKVIDETGSGSALDIAQGIIWAADHKANIINLSIGSPVPSRLVEDAVTYAYDTGALIIGAAGNCGGEDYQVKGCLSRHQLDYPGAYPAVIAVTSIKMDHAISAFASHGTHIALAAPGEEIYSTFINDQYATQSGTSFAVAHVAGAAALIWSENTNLSNHELRTALQQTALDLGEPGLDVVFGYGLLNTHAAVSETISIKIINGNSPLNNALLLPTVVAPKIEFMPGEILVKVKTAALPSSMRKVLSELQVNAITHIEIAPKHSFAGLYLLKVQVGTEERSLHKLSTLTDVEYAELHYIYKMR